MSKLKLMYIGKITYQKLKEVIHKENLSKEDTIILNPENFKDIVIEYQNLYEEDMKLPHLLLGVLIREAKNEIIPLNRIGVFKKRPTSLLC